MEDGESRNTLDVIAVVGVEMDSVGEFDVIFSDKGTLCPTLLPLDDNGLVCMGSLGGVSGAYHPPCVFVVGVALV